LIKVSHSRSWQYSVEVVVHKFPEWKVVENEKIEGSSLETKKRNSFGFSRR
jgi:hypothetical protein